MKRFSPIILIILAMAIIYTGVRSTVITNAERSLRTAVRSLEDQGYTFRFDKLEQGGFPYRIALTFTDVSLTDTSNTIEGTADEIVLISHIWTPNHWLLNVKGLSLDLLDRGISLSDDFVAISHKVYDDGRTVIVADSQEAGDFILKRAPGLTQSMTAENWVFSTVLPAKRQASDNLYEATIADFRLQVAGGEIGDGKAPHEYIAGLEITGSLTGEGLTRWQEKQAVQWSSNGGLIDVKTFNILVGRKGPNQAALGTSGTLSVDAQTNLLGTFSVKAQNMSYWSKIFESSNLFPRRGSLAHIQSLPEKTEIGIMMQGGAVLIANRQVALTDRLFD
ncbi:DUF2125 domain-containing protein [Temperatibacter marinus]|uniref:DUF2125 domain-containing protein n=1 Tax=Temperatibacter marinus TaxID=1456591 RepID=A0AA52EHY8_9PROT|nr:DUF2125 domain-containing protein [Temperatibacter marinus]WND03973.1 DUF2125 domain-containing protein [Temperatibacter marinus]